MQATMWSTDKICQSLKFFYFLPSKSVVPLLFQRTKQGNEVRANYAGLGGNLEGSFDEIANGLIDGLWGSA
jgi:hypothetical protein